MARARKKRVCSFTLDDDVYAELRRQADGHYRSNSGELNSILRSLYFGDGK